jgi:hypothetical protein
MKRSRADGRAKIRSFTDVLVAESCLHLAGALVEQQLMTSCPTLCCDHVQRTLDSSH